MSTAAAAVKISPALKALVAAPYSFPNPLPAPARPVLNRLFDSIRSKGEAGGVGPETWLTLGAASLCTVNSPESLCRLFDYAKERAGGIEDQVKAAAVMREVGLKCISFNGIPRVS